MSRGPYEVPDLRTSEPQGREVLRRVRHAGHATGARPGTALLHAAAPRGEDPDLAKRARGRAQGGHRPLRRHPELHGAPGGGGSMQLTGSGRIGTAGLGFLLVF